MKRRNGAEASEFPETRSEDEEGDTELIADGSEGTINSSR